MQSARPGGMHVLACVTATYVRASLAEVAAALTGEPHPLAAAEGW